MTRLSSNSCAKAGAGTKNRPAKPRRIRRRMTSPPLVSAWASVIADCDTTAAAAGKDKGRRLRERLFDRFEGQQHAFVPRLVRSDRRKGGKGLARRPGLTAD